MVTGTRTGDGRRPHVPSPGGRPARRPRHAAWRAAAVAVALGGELAITAAFVLVLFCAYQMWGTGTYTEQQQQILQRQVFAEPARGRLGPVRMGDALAIIRIPRFGKDYRFAIVEGVDAARLREGPGHYPGTALPGDRGNFVVSGHRTTYAAPFKRLAELRPGDHIVIDTYAARHTYRVTSTSVVDPADLGVIAPVPGRPDVRPARSLITLTTCHPEFSDRQRLVVHGELVSTRPHET